MKIGGNCSDVLAPARVATVWRVEKPNASSNLRDDTRRQPARPTLNAQRSSSARLSRFETRSASDVERAVVQSGFIAQVLGQILGAETDNRIIASRAYARSRDASRETRLVEIL